MKTWKKRLIHLAIPLTLLAMSKISCDKAMNYGSRINSLTKENPSIERIIEIETAFDTEELKKKLRNEPEKYYKYIEEYKSLINKPNILNEVDKVNRLTNIELGYLFAFVAPLMIVGGYTMAVSIYFIDEKKESIRKFLRRKLYKNP